MDLITVFFWFCKNKGIMKEVFNLYENSSYTRLFINDEGKVISKKLSLKEKINNSSRTWLGIEGIFSSLIFISDIDDFDDDVLNVLDKSANAWSKFVANNLFFHDDFLKEGDYIECTRFKQELKGRLVNVDKWLRYVTIEQDNGGLVDVFFHENIKINGNEKKEPKFYIKYKRKVYGK